MRRIPVKRAGISLTPNNIIYTRVMTFACSDGAWKRPHAWAIPCFELPHCLSSSTQAPPLIITMLDN